MVGSDGLMYLSLTEFHINTYMPDVLNKCNGNVTVESGGSSSSFVRQQLCYLFIKLSVSQTGGRDPLGGRGTFSRGS